MSYPVPKYTKSTINRAGKILVDSKASTAKREFALEVLSNWRACHGYPVNTFQSTLRSRVERLGNHSLVAQRLKRLSTIEDKLKRFSGMALSTMQDIGGLRAVVKSVDYVRKLESMYLTSGKRFQHELIRKKDYIMDPKPDGYRGVHLVYKYKNKLKPKYDGFSVELQLRTQLQHTWATAVETMSINLKQALKTGGGEGKWRDFFAIASSAFSYIEKSPRVPKYKDLSEDKTYKNLIAIEKEIKAIETMRGLSLALSKVSVNKRRQNFYYHLIVLNFVERTVSVNSYPKSGIKKATDEYIKAELEATKNGQTDAVLVSAGNLNALKRAYPNYFLNVTDFINKIQTIVDSN